MISSAIGDRAALYPNVKWVDRTRPRGPARDGELDLLVVDRDRGVLAIEVKSGPVRLDGHGRWYAGNRVLDESPFTQVETSKYAIGRKITGDRRWPGGQLRLVHAVAFPSTDRGSVAAAGSLGTDAPLEIVLDRADVARPEAAADALERVYEYWSGDGSRDRSLSDAQLAAIAGVIEPDVQLRPLLRGDIERGEEELLVPTKHQLTLLKTLAREPRAAIEGGAGSGKTLLAAEKAKQLAALGYNTLLICFNQPLAKALAEWPELAVLQRQHRLTVSTFHELCRRLAWKAGVLPLQPKNPGSDWFSKDLPAALDRAIPSQGGNLQAIVVDEGQDFDASWLASLDLLLAEPGQDVFYLFHDPAQAMYREDKSETLGLRPFVIEDNCRNAKPIHDFAYRFYSGELRPQPLRDDGRQPEIVIAEAGKPTVDAVRAILHRLIHDEGVERSRIVILTGVALAHSALWKQRRFKGGIELWNGSVDDAGVSKGLAAGGVGPQPEGSIAIETIHRFKGLERDVVVLAELRPDDERIDKLLYIGATRAKHHLVAVVPPQLSMRDARVATELDREGT